MKRNVFRKATCTAVAGLLLVCGCVNAGAAVIEPDAFTALDNAEPDAAGDSLPSAYSSLELGYVTSVKSQSYNSCWAYSAMGTLESALLRAGFQDVDMSVNHLNMWATERSNEKGWIRMVDDSGYSVIAPGYLASWQGGVLQSDLGDYPLDWDTPGDAVPTGMARYGVTAIEYLKKDDVEGIKRAIMDHGGVSTSYANAGNCWSTNRQAYFMPQNYSSGYVGHSIEVVGWDDSYPRDNFDGAVGAKPENDGAWLIKNSWGKNHNAIGGYFWASYEDLYLFASKYKPTYYIRDFEVLDGSQKLIQNEIYGATYEFNYIDESELTFMNRLSFDSEFNAIDKIVFKTESVGAQYHIDFVPDGADGTPTTDTSGWTRLYDGTVDYTGYICADITDFIYPEEGGSVAVTIDASASGGKSTIGVGEWLESSEGFVFINESGRGESYVMQDGEKQDLMDWYHDNNNDDMGGTFVIKAITVKKSPVTLLGDADMDGRVTIYDVTRIQRHLAQMLELTGSAYENADYNRDGKITIEDATQIQFVLAELV